MRERQQHEIPHPLLMRIAQQTEGRHLRRKYTFTSEGLDRIPLHGPVAAISNHRNNPLDVKTVGLLSPRHFYFPAKSEINDGVMGWILKGCGALYFDRDDEKDRDRVAQESARKMRLGAAVLYFWEGTSQNRGMELGSVNEGPVMAALRQNLPIHPIALAGTEGPDIDHIHMVVGKPIDLSEIRSSRQALRKSGQTPKPTIETAMDIVVPTHQELIYYAHEQLEQLKKAA